MPLARQSQILMFSILACKTKQNAPRCHTYLEIIYVRYGKLTHCIFIFFALMTNVLVGSQLLLGGSAVVTSLTGMNVYAAIFLIPLGVCAYVLLGGLRATFLMRLFSHAHSDGHNPILHVRSVQPICADWIT